MTERRGLVSRLRAAVAGRRARNRPPSAADTAVRVSYDPEADGRPDPGEVVWAWVPYEDDPSQGKDRPCLVIGVDGADLALVALTSKGGRDDQVPVGTGPWDPQRRPSYAKLEHVYAMGADEIRREGAALPRERFDAVVAALRRLHPGPLDTDL